MKQLFQSCRGRLREEVIHCGGESGGPRVRQTEGSAAGCVSAGKGLNHSVLQSLYP